MIFELTFAVFNTLIELAFALIPDLPPMPEAITDAGNFAIGLIAIPIQLMNYLYGQAFFAAMITMLIIAFNFEKVYRLAMFVIKKIPFINIK